MWNKVKFTISTSLIGSLFGLEIYASWLFFPFSLSYHWINGISTFLLSEIYHFNPLLGNMILKVE